MQENPSHPKPGKHTEPCSAYYRLARAGEGASEYIDRHTKKWFRQCQRICTIEDFHSSGDVGAFLNKILEIAFVSGRLGFRENQGKVDWKGRAKYRWIIENNSRKS